MKKEKEGPKGAVGSVGIQGCPSSAETNKPDYSNITLDQVFVPGDNDVVIEEPRLMSKFLEIAKAQGEQKAPMDMDMVFTIVAVGKSWQDKYEIGDKVLVKGGSTFPVNLVSDKHFQIWGDMIAGKVVNPDYEKIRKFFNKKRDEETTKVPKHQPAILGMDGKMIPRIIDPKEIN